MRSNVLNNIESDTARPVNSKSLILERTMVPNTHRPALNVRVSKRRPVNVNVGRTGATPQHLAATRQKWYGTTRSTSHPGGCMPKHTYGTERSPPQPDNDLNKGRRDNTNPSATANIASTRRGGNERRSLLAVP